MTYPHRVWGPAVCLGDTGSIEGCLERVFELTAQRVGRVLTAYLGYQQVVCGCNVFRGTSSLLRRYPRRI